MSLVGTRPILQDELLKYELHHRARIAIKPGITGMWQVSGRSDITDFEEVVRLDTEYISKVDLSEYDAVHFNRTIDLYWAKDSLSAVISMKNLLRATQRSSGDATARSCHPLLSSAFLFVLLSITTTSMLFIREFLLAAM